MALRWPSECFAATRPKGGNAWAGRAGVAKIASGMPLRFGPRFRCSANMEPMASIVSMESWRSVYATYTGDQTTPAALFKDCIPARALAGGGGNADVKDEMGWASRTPKANGPNTHARG